MSAEVVVVDSSMVVSALIDSDVADQALVDLDDQDVAFSSFAPFQARVWELRDNVTSYDAWYVALAEDLNAPMATLDLRLTTASGPRCQFLTPPPPGLP